MLALPSKTLRIDSLGVSDVVQQVINDPMYSELKLAPPVRAHVDVVRGALISGLGNCHAALRAGETDIAVRERLDLWDEDPGVFSIIFGWDVIPSTADPLAVGLAYRWVRRDMAQFPKRGNKEEREVHLRVHGVTRADRLALLCEQHFGQPRRVLNRYEQVLDAPPEVRQAFRTGALSLSKAVAVVRQDRR